MLEHKRMNKVRESQFRVAVSRLAESIRNDDLLHIMAEMDEKHYQECLKQLEREQERIAEHAD